MQRIETPGQILNRLYEQVCDDLACGWVVDQILSSRIGYLANCQSNRAGARLLMACMLAKVHRPSIDPREPYTEIGTDTSFSGRTYDERFLTGFVREHGLPCNSSSAFVTPALRNLDAPLLIGTDLVGRPREMYSHVLEILDEVAEGRVHAEDVLSELLRFLCLVREEQLQLRSELQGAIGQSDAPLSLSSEGIVTLIEQHLACRNSSRLPVLVVAAAYEAARDTLGEQISSLHAHNAADEQTGAMGDVEVYLSGETDVVTAYEMKNRLVTKDDIDRAIDKISAHHPPVDNYIFVTTQPIDPIVQDYAGGWYEPLGGVEIAVLDCIGFLRHFLHLFHRSRTAFLNCYQDLVLAEPASAVREDLKTTFLSLRLAAQSE